MAIKLPTDVIEVYLTRREIEAIIIASRNVRGEEVGERRYYEIAALDIKLTDLLNKD